MKTKKKIIGIITFVLFLILLPIGVKHTAVYYLTKAGAENVTIDDVDINLFTGTLKIEKLRISSEHFEPLSLSSAVINISMVRLLTGKVVVEQSVVDGLKLVVENNKENLVIGFPVFSKTSNEDPPENKTETDDDKDFPFGIKKILISNSVIKYQDEKAANLLDINKIRLFDFYFWEKNNPAVFKMDVLVNRARLKADIVMKPFADKRSVESHIRIDKLKLNPFSAYLVGYIDDFHSTITSDIKISASINKDNLIEVEQSGSFDVSEIKAGFCNLPVPVNIFNAAFSYTGKSHAKLIAGEDFPVFEVNGVFANDELNSVISDEKVSIKHGGIKWDGIIKNTTGLPDKTDAVGKFTFEKLFIDGEDEKNHIVSIDKFNLNDLNVKGKEITEIDFCEILGFSIAETVEENNEKKGVLPFDTDNIIISKIKLANMNQLSVDSIEIKNINIPLEKNEDGTLPLANLLNRFKTGINSIIPKTENKTEAAETTEVVEATEVAETTDTVKTIDTTKVAEITETVAITEAEEVVETLKNKEQASGFIVDIGSVLFKGKNKIIVRDSSVKPSYVKEIEIDTFSLTDINNLNENNQSKLDLLLKTEQRATIDLKGTVQLFSPKVNLNMKGNVKGLPLAEFSPYVSSAVGYNIQTGVLNTKVDCKIISDKLDINNDLFVEKIILIPDSKGKVTKFAKSFVMPIDQTVSILRDSDNNIKLSLPVTGDIKDPDFHYDDVMKIALTKAAKSATISVIKNLIQPYGVVVTAAEYAYAGTEFITKVRMSPVMFTQASSELNGDGRKYLDTIVKLLTKKKGLRVSVCGFSTALDIQGVDYKKNPDPFVELAKDRQSNVILYLEDSGIAYKRLFQCNGDIDPDEDAKPRVEMSI